MALLQFKSALRHPLNLKDRLNRKPTNQAQEISDEETSGDDSGLEAQNQSIDKSESKVKTTSIEQEENHALSEDKLELKSETSESGQKEDERGDAKNTHWGNTLGAMKDRAVSAKSNIKNKASIQLGKYQPQLTRVKTSASAGSYNSSTQLLGFKNVQHLFLYDIAATKGREAANIGSLGWSKFKHKLASTGPVAEGLSIISKYQSHDSIHIESIAMLEGSTRTYGCRFLDAYRLNAQAKEESDSNDALCSYATQCVSNCYILGNILLFCGELQVLGRVNQVNRSCHQFISSEKKLWRFCVRYGRLPQSLRAPFWEYVAGVNDTRTNSELDFKTYVEMAKSKGDCSELIETDVQRAYGSVVPHRRIKADGRDEESAVATVDEILLEQLSSILHALSSRFPDVGYCQGMDYIAVHVLDYMKKQTLTETASTANSSGAIPTCRTAATPEEVERAFWLLVCLFEQYDLRQTYLPGLQDLHSQCFQLKKITELTMPALAEHLEKNKVITEMYMVGWSQTLFLYLTVLPRQTLDRLWDIFIWEKNAKIIMRGALALLQIAEPHIRDQETDEIMQFLSSFDGRSEELLREEDVLEKALAVKITSSVLSKLQRQRLKQKRTLENKRSYNFLLPKQGK